MDELLDNGSGRLRFDTWNMNGLIVFKEGSKLIMDVLQSGLMQQDPQISVKILTLIMSMMCKCLSGGYINFAICDFYHDNSYTQLTSFVVT